MPRPHLPVPRAAWALPGPLPPRRSPHGFQSFTLRRKKNKKLEEQKENVLSKGGKSFPAAAATLAERPRRKRAVRLGAGRERAPGARLPRSRPPFPGLGLNLTPSLLAHRAGGPCPPNFGHIPSPKPPTLPAEPLRSGLEPSAGGGRGKLRSARWHLWRMLLNPGNISPSHLMAPGELHTPRGGSPLPGVPRARVLPALGRDFFWRCWGTVTLQRSPSRVETPGSRRISAPLLPPVQSWKLSSLEKSLLKLIGCKHN